MMNLKHIKEEVEDLKDINAIGKLSLKGQGMLSELEYVLGRHEQQINLTIPIVSTITIAECWWCHKNFDNTTMLMVNSSEFGVGGHPICPCCNEKFNLVWINVNDDRMPDHNGFVLCCNINDEDAPICIGLQVADGENGFYITELQEKSNQVTHWMELPEKPGCG